VVLGLPHLLAEGCHNFSPRLSFLSQAIRAGPQTCALEELDAAAGGTQKLADNI
jgi:hypothetical protein